MDDLICIYRSTKYDLYIQREKIGQIWNYTLLKNEIKYYCKELGYDNGIKIFSSKAQGDIHTNKLIKGLQRSEGLNK